MLQSSVNPVIPTIPFKRYLYTLFMVCRSKNKYVIEISFYHFCSSDNPVKNGMFDYHAPDQFAV